MVEVLNRLDVTAYKFVGLSKKWFYPGTICDVGYHAAIQQWFNVYPWLRDELGDVPSSVRATNVSLPFYAPNCVTSVTAGYRALTRVCPP